MKKIILILSLILSLTLLFASCSEEEAEITTVPDGTTAAPETERVINTEPMSKADVKNPSWGFAVHSVKSLDETIVKASFVKGMGDVMLTSYNPGETEVHVLDCFEHKAVIKVTVADDAERTITFEAKPCEEDFVNAAEFGVIASNNPNNLVDQASKLQAAIDKVWKDGGGTVFLYPGFYKISVITMRDGVTLKMYSGFTDAREGFTDELAEMVKKGEVTVLMVTRILSTD
ncbi:MAG: hypothetical protein J6S71_05075, partial [Clostridia bacterium]|nr:hypothetical protein [Clostridia bacterium]